MQAIQHPSAHVRDVALAQNTTPLRVVNNAFDKSRYLKFVVPEEIISSREGRVQQSVQAVSGSMPEYRYSNQSLVCGLFQTLAVETVHYAIHNDEWSARVDLLFG